MEDGGLGLLGPSPRRLDEASQVAQLTALSTDKARSREIPSQANDIQIQLTVSLVNRAVAHGHITLDQVKAELVRPQLRPTDDLRELALTFPGGKP